MRIEIFSDDPIMNVGVIVFFILFAFLLFISITYLRSLFRKQSKTILPNVWPGVSVIVPAYNEEENIKSCLTAIAAIEYTEGKMQIIVVDDRSTDSTLRIAQEFAAHSKKLKGVPIEIISEAHEGKVCALNRGLIRAKHGFIVTIDADITVERDVIKKLVSPMLGAQRIAATNCVAMVRNPRNMLEHYQRIEFFLNNLIRASFSEVFRNSIWFFGAAACYRKDALADVGGFKKDSLTEDMDLCLELYRAGYTIKTVPDAVVSTMACPTLRSLARQRMRWYYGSLQALTKNKATLKAKQRSPAIYFLYFNQYWWTVFAFIFFPLVAYQVNYWWPHGTGTYDAFMYLFRWFSLAGPFYVLYKIPQWGLSFLNLFGVLSGIITLFITFDAIRGFRGRITLPTLVAIFFYFPYTILLNAILIAGVIKYRITGQRYFINR